ncbi:hypothetical protein [Vibrio gallaecicus]|uniref:Uncharacterized protein n=1 Tax=Vibrio gallaecicus TaxID=552386 RepID=A0ABV4NE66_9VIBR
MRAVWIFIIIVSTLVYGCMRRESIERNCFEPFSISPTDYFNTPEPQLWYIIGGNSGDDFLVDNNIFAYVVEGDFAQKMTPLDPDSSVNFTGNVYKFWPSWPEKFLGGGDNNIQFEVFIDRGKFLVFDELERNENIPSIEERCDF